MPGGPLSGLPAHLAGLLRPQAYPHPVGRIELVETHISWVLLTGEVAYKIKRPVRLEFIDLTSFERRAFYCAEELRLNQRFAPKLYTGVCDIREGPDGPHIATDGEGRLIERCVRMRQFPSDEQLDRLLAAGRIDAAALEGFGRALARIHSRLPSASRDQSWGNPDVIANVVRQNLDQYGRAVARIGGAPQLETLRAQLHSALAATSGCMQERKANGRVRECHGDLHSRNIARLGQELVAFDCLEFEPAFRWIDVAEEIAFLVADLDVRAHPQHAHAFLSGYLAESGDYQACRLLPLYRAHRSLVRAKVAALEIANAADAAGAASARESHERHFRGALAALRNGAPRLILMSGLSGSGKTWLATQLAPRLRAVHLRSDVERKRLAGLDATARSHSAPGAGLYTSERSSQVYAHLARCAEDVLAGGYTAIVDATFLERAHRQPFASLAQNRAVPMVVLHCEAPVEVLRERIRARQRLGADASEADLNVLDWQLRNAEPPGADESVRIVSIETKEAGSVEQALRALGEPMSRA